MNHISHIIITVHGIRTFGQWQNKLKALIEEQSVHTRVFNYTYGYFSVIAFLIPPLRWLVVRNFRQELLAICKDNPAATIDLVGHSFGTHLIAWGIQTIKPDRKPKIRNIILAGSVLKSNFNWSFLFSSGHVERVTNDCGINDNVLIINQLFVLFTGMAGRLGFQGMTGNHLINRYFIGGHSLYFEDGNVLSEKFMREHWLPTLIENKAPTIVDQRKTPSALEGLLTTIIQNAELVKFSIYSIILITPFLIYFNLYQIAENERIKTKKLLIEAEEAKKGLAHSLIELINKSLKIPFAIYFIQEEIRPIFEFTAEKIVASNIRENIRIECHIGKFQWANTPDNKQTLYTNFNFHYLKEYEHGSNPREYAMALGERYANSLRDSLVAKGYPGELIEVISYGTEDPKYPYPKNNDYDEWNTVAAKNNRCEIKFITSSNF